MFTWGKKMVVRQLTAFYTVPFDSSNFQILQSHVCFPNDGISCSQSMRYVELVITLIILVNLVKLQLEVSVKHWLISVNFYVREDFPFEL